MCDGLYYGLLVCNLNNKWARPITIDVFYYHIKHAHTLINNAINTLIALVL